MVDEADGSIVDGDGNAQVHEFQILSERLFPILPEADLPSIDLDVPSLIL
ncbi:MAG: hypothetical protein ACC645_20065 [Pirellulales bacterium]